MLLIGLGVLPRLTLRVSLLYLPFRRGVRLGERGEIVRRAREGVRESGLSSEYGDRVRGRPRSGDREGILLKMWVSARIRCWSLGKIMDFRTRCLRH